MLYSMVSCNDGNRESILFLIQPSSIAPDSQAKGKIYHLLHLYYQWFVPGDISTSICTNGSNSSSSNSSILSESLRSRRIISWLGLKIRSNEKTYMPMRSIPSATNLQEAGVSFQRKECPSDLFDITFENGVMEIPVILIDCVRKVFYLNLAAFKWSCSAMEYDLMSYVALMNSLIKTNKDVLLLQRCGIINNMLLNEDELTVFFNQLSDWSTFNSDKHYFASLFSDVQLYSNSRWHKYRAKLMHHYFNNPWSVLSVIAALVLLVLTATQALYAMYPIIHHH